MNTYSEEKNKSQPSASAISRKPDGEDPGHLTVEINSANGLQSGLGNLANESPRAKQSSIYQQQADSSVQFKQSAQLQSIADNHSSQRQLPVKKIENNTGLPDHLKSGIENLSGFAMDDVKVHYNSSKPSQLKAHAYAQGTDIHIAPGQEQHLPHEAWHVVQQKQGRVQPTMQLKGSVNVNDDKALENEADVMGNKATQTAHNKLIDNKLTEDYSSIKPVHQLVKIKLDNGKYHPPVYAGGVEVESDDLIPEERTTANTDLEGDKALINSIRNGWKQLAKNVDPVIQPILNAAKITDPARKIEVRKLYQASQDAGVTLPVLLQAQKDWQDFLSENDIPMSTILSVHRSFGFEYEFATWELNPPNMVDVPSHTEVGKSAPFSALFNTPFILETDAQKELELVAPPLLAGQGAGGINKAFISQVHALFISTLVTFRTNNLQVRVNALPFDAEIGSGWAWAAPAATIRIATVRNKWSGKANQIGYQLNIALTPDEISGQVEEGGDGGNIDHGNVYTDILNRFLNHVSYTGLTPERKNGINSAIHLLSKGISNAIAIPTLSLVARTRKPWVSGDLHSYIKDLHGIWIKDSVPNITLAAVKGNDLAKHDLRNLILALRGGGDLITRDILTKIPDYKPPTISATPGIVNMRNVHTELDTASRNTTLLKLAAQQEAIACLTAISTRLADRDGSATVNSRPAFLTETFGTGDGVRKDTYVNIPSSAKSTLHLAELRSNASTDAFLAK